MCGFGYADLGVQEILNRQPLIGGVESNVSSNSSHDRISQALGLIPGSLYIMTAHHEERDRGVMVTMVQQVAISPPMILVALPKGRPIIPTINNAHAFALCQVAEDDRLARRRFPIDRSADDDVFNTLDFIRGKTGSPILRRSVAYLDCEVVRHIDIEADHDLYIGQVIAAEVFATDPLNQLTVQFNRPSDAIIES